MVTLGNVQVIVSHMDNNKPSIIAKPGSGIIAKPGSGIIAKPGSGIIAKNICTVHKRCKTLAQIIDDCVNMDMDNMNCPKLLFNWYKDENRKIK